MTNNLDEILVVSDVDGTLLQAGYGIPEENIDTIERFVKLGGRFTFATGRGIASAGKYTDWIKLSAPAILANGALIYDYSQNKVLSEHTLDPGVRVVLRELMDVFPQLGVEVLIREKAVVLRMNEEIHEHTAVEHVPVVLTDIETVADGWNKILFADRPEVIMYLKEYVEKRLKHDERFRKYDFVQTEKAHYELVAKNINKASGLEKLADIVGIDMKNTVAIGDFFNDVEIFNVAGLSAAVEEAPEEIKSTVDIVVGPCLGGGVAQLLNKLLSDCGV